MKKAVICLTMMSFLLPSLGHAAYDGMVVGTIKVLIVKSNVSSQALVVQLEGMPELCGSSQTVAILAEDAPAWKAVFSVALAAYVSGKKVQVVSDDVGGQCVIRQIRLDTSY